MGKNILTFSIINMSRPFFSFYCLLTSTKEPLTHEIVLGLWSKIPSKGK